MERVQKKVPLSGGSRRAGGLRCASARMAVLLHSLARSSAFARPLLRARSPAPSLFLARSFALARLLLAFARPHLAHQH